MSNVPSANTLRGEAELLLGEAIVRFRPTFTALVAAEAEVGPLFALVERAAAGELTLVELTALFWHCRAACDLARPDFSEALIAGGLAEATPALRTLLGQVLQGR